jgi:pimeloyl-ACP methyl ester carboxylesterase
LNVDRPGDAPSIDSLVNDVIHVARALVPKDLPFHFGGFCWGSTYAINVLERGSLQAKSFIMLAPAIFPAPDIGGANFVTGSSGEPTEHPQVPIDRFTSGPAFQDYIIPDTLRTRRVSPRFNRIMLDMNRMLGPRWARLRLPTLMLQATADTISDTKKHLRAFQTLRVAFSEHHSIVGGHGLQFDAPAETAELVSQWIGRPEFA